MRSSTLATFAFAAAMNAISQAAPLEPGAPAPQVASVDQSGAAVNLADVYAKGPTLVYFYPKADTPGCTKQACSLRDEWSSLQDKGIQVLGVSGDKPESQAKFQTKYKLPFTLLADSDGTVAKAFGVPFNAGFAKRQSFLIKDGKIVWTMPSASTADHAKDVMAAYEKLAKG